MSEVENPRDRIYRRFRLAKNWLVLILLAAIAAALWQKREPVLVSGVKRTRLKPWIPIALFILALVVIASSAGETKKTERRQENFVPARSPVKRGQSPSVKARTVFRAGALVCATIGMIGSRNANSSRTPAVPSEDAR